MHPWSKQIQMALKPLADSNNARLMKAYMRDQYDFYGIQATQRRTAVKALFSKPQLPPLEETARIVRELWQLPEREYQMVAVDLLIKRKTQLTDAFLPDLEWLITTKSWWDTVDMLASHIAAALFLHHQYSTQEYIMCWRQSDNLWLRRTTILYQLKFKHQTDQELLFEIIKENQSDNEFFIQKAMGWALREHSKTNPVAVSAFIEQQGIEGLAKREGLKWLSKQNAVLNQ